MNFGNKNLIINFVWHLEMAKRYDIEISSIDKVLNREHFCKKILQKIGPKSSSRTLFSFGK